MGDVFERIKKIRKDNKLNQQEFARIIDLSQTHISKIENGKDNPSDKSTYSPQNNSGRVWHKLRVVKNGTRRHAR